MSRLSKSQAKAHAQACELLNKEVLTLEERQFVLDNWQESANHINSVSGAFFTPSALARDLSIYVGEGSLIDLCAGIGALAFHAIDRFHRNERQRIVCLELNPDYVAVGRKVVPEATWVCGNVFDLPADLGTFDYAISNPPFGRMKDLPLSGLPLDLNVVAVAARLARQGVFILPQGSCPFEFSGRQGYLERESEPYESFHARTGVRLYCSSVDCAFHIDAWRGVSPKVEIARFDLDEDVAYVELGEAAPAKRAEPMPAVDGRQMDLFAEARP